MKSVFKSWFLENICLKIPASVFRMWVYHEGLFGGKHRQNVWKHHSNPERWAWDCRSEQYDIKHSWHSCWSREAFVPLKKKSWKYSMYICISKKLCYFICKSGGCMGLFLRGNMICIKHWHSWNFFMSFCMIFSYVIVILGWYHNNLLMKIKYKNFLLVQNRFFLW